MKKFIALIFALFFATATVAETFEASEKITQEVQVGELTQEVFVGDSIKPIKILYTNIEENKHQSGNISELGLTEKWVGSVCEIFGKISRNIAAQTVKAYILVQDDKGKYAKTDIIFEIKEKPFSFAWNETSGEMKQTVKAGETMVPIVFDYEAISVWGVSGLPSGLKGDIDEDEHAIVIAGTVGETVMSGDYDYKVTVKDKNSEEHTLSGTISVEGLPNVASISIVENEKQKVTAGDTIKPIVFRFANVSVTENLENFKFEQTLPGSLKISVEGNVLTINGDVAENTKDGSYSIKVIVKGEKNNDTAFATVEVVHKSVVTRIYAVENETQTATAGDSIEPIVFKFENMVDYEKPTGFPGSYKVVPDEATKTLTVIGLLSENAKGPYTIKLTVNGADNNASAEATINVTPVKLKFELVEGSDNQTVIAGNAITPIVYQYDHVLSSKGSGFPADLKVDYDEENKRIKISGTVSSKSAANEYVYTFALKDVYGEDSTVTGKINVVRESSSSSVASSSSVTESSSSATISSSSVASSSSSAVSSSSVGSSSSSVVDQSSSSVEPSSSSSNEDNSSSSEKTTKIVAAAMNAVKVGYANNMLTVALPTSSMVRVQVFDLMGHLVESLVEPVAGSRSFSLAHLNKGNYLVRVESNSQSRTARIAVK